MYPHIAANLHRAWTIGDIIHRCDWCTDRNFAKHVADCARMHARRKRAPK
jgi:hypothetical protein